MKSTWPYFLIALLGLSLYLQTASFDFAYDDGPRILREPVVTESKSITEAFAQAFSRPTYPGDLYRPVTTATFWLNWTLFGAQARSFHVTNMVLHILAGILVLLTCQTLTGQRMLSVFIAAVFTVHPVQVESVANISGRAELLAAIFVLAAILSLCAGQTEERPLLRAFRSASACVCVLLAVLSKESGIVAAGLAPLCAWWTNRAPAKSLITTAAALTLTAFISVLLRYGVLAGNFLHAEDSAFVVENPLLSPGTMLSTRLFVASATLGWYLKLLLVPKRLSADYAMGQAQFEAQLTSFDSLFHCGLIFVWVVGALLSKRERWGLFAFWFLIAFLPTANLLFPIGVLKAERLCYLPSIGFIAFLGSLLNAQLRLGAATTRTLACLIVVAFGARAWLRVPAWENDRTLFLQTVRDAPRSPKAHEHAGKIYFHTIGNLSRAREHFTTSLTLQPLRREALEYLLRIELKDRNRERAQSLSNEILHHWPDSEVARATRRLLAEAQQE